MATPFSFPSTTTRLGLPLLFSGQAQKEFFINQALALVDTLTSARVEQTLTAPHPDPADGACFRIGTPAAGEWESREDQLAIWIGGTWHFVEPWTGMRVYDAEAGALMFYNSGWSSPAEPIPATGGATVDAEARQMLAELVETLKNAGIFPNP